MFTIQITWSYQQQHTNINNRSQPHCVVWSAIIDHWQLKKNNIDIKQQKVNNSNPRSTVGTSSEIYEYIKLLFSRIGITYSPISNEKVKKDSVDSVISLIKSLNVSDKFLILVKLNKPSDVDLKDFFQFYFDQGYARIEHDGETMNILEASEKKIGDSFLYG